MTVRMFLALLLQIRRLLSKQKFVSGLGCSMVVSLTCLTLIGCDGSDELEQKTTSNSSHDGVSVGLVWDPVEDSRILGYYIHYGKRSPKQPGSCAYDQELFVTSRHGTVTNLDPGFIYYFAVSAYNGLDSSCSNEVFVHTPSIDCCPP